jgi:hypothetical protein
MKKIKKTIKNKSWKTTSLGITGLVVAIGPVISELFSKTHGANIDWTKTGGMVALAVGLIFARDNDKSSKSVGVE